MITTHAPAQLPFGPKPFRNELCSSWLLRLASANCVSLEELLLGFEARYPSTPCTISLDLNLEPEFLASMARFSRVPATTLHRLSLEKAGVHTRNLPCCSTSATITLAGALRTFAEDLDAHSAHAVSHSRALCTCLGNGPSPISGIAPFMANLSMTYADFLEPRIHCRSDLLPRQTGFPVSGAKRTCWMKLVKGSADVHRQASRWRKPIGQRCSKSRHKQHYPAQQRGTSSGAS